jgi:hypothetical protein
MQQADYAAVKNGFITKARTLTDYFTHSWQVTDDDSDANRGGKHFLIVKPGAVPIAPLPNLVTKKIYQVDWNLVFDLQVKYKSYKQAWGEFSGLRDAVLNLFVFTMKKELPGVFGVWNVMITAPEPPGLKMSGGLPTWAGQQCVAIVTQRIDVSR